MRKCFSLRGFKTQLKVPTTSTAGSRTLTTLLTFLSNIDHHHDRLNTQSRTLQNINTFTIPASTTERFTNENWQIIMSEIAPGAIKQIIQSCVDKVQQFFSAIPAKELLLQSWMVGVIGSHFSSWERFYLRLIITGCPACAFVIFSLRKMLSMPVYSSRCE